MKLRLRILAWVHIAIGGVGLSAFGTLLLGYATTRDRAYDDEFAWMGGLLGLATVVYFLPMLIGGIGILSRLPWARAMIWMVSALLALAVPFGTLLAGFGLWALLTTADFSGDGGMARIERIVRNALHMIVLILIALFILGVIVGVGWVFRDQIDPPVEQELTPLPSGVPPSVPRPDFTMPDTKEFGLPRAPGQ